MASDRKQLPGLNFLSVEAPSNVAIIDCPQCGYDLENRCMARCSRCGYYEPCGSEPATEGRRATRRDLLPSVDPSVQKKLFNNVSPRQPS
jgi:hypothetical protein